MGQKADKAPKKNRRAAQGKEDRAYLARVAALPCIVCKTHHEAQLTRTTVHHTIDGRNSQTKTADSEAIPLCDCHHQGRLLNSKIAKHQSPKKWRELYGLDTDYIEITRALLA